MQYEEERKIGDQLDLKIIFREIFDAKIFLIGITILVTALTALYTLTMPNIYKSSVKLEPAIENNASTSMKGLSSILGGFDSSLGQAIGKTQQALEIIESKDFFEKLYQNEDFLIELMAYDTGLTESIIDASIYDSQSSTWVNKKPTLMESHRRFYSEHFSKSAPKDTPFITIGIEHYSPVYSKKWLDLVLNELDIFLKERDLKISEEKIRFLEERMSQSNQTTKIYLSQLLIMETQKLIQTKVDSFYAFTVIDSPRIPEFKEGPKRAVICLAAAGASFFLSFFIITVLSALNKRLNFSFRKFSFSIENIE